MYFYIAIFSNGKKYIGITANIYRRKSQHKTLAKKGFKGCFYNAIRKYGFDDITWEIADGYNSWDELCKLEIKSIVDYNTIDRLYGYNISPGGDGYVGMEHSQEIKELIFKIKGGKNGLTYGKKLTQEQKEHLSKINSGKNHPRYGQKRTIKQKEAMKKGYKKYCQENGPPFLGKHHSKETKHKISKKNSGKNNGMYDKPSPRAKLKETDVIEIREKYKSGNFTQTKLAKLYNVSVTLINSIINYKLWKKIFHKG